MLTILTNARTSTFVVAAPATDTTVTDIVRLFMHHKHYIATSTVWKEKNTYIDVVMGIGLKFIIDYWLHSKHRLSIIIGGIMCVCNMVVIGLAVFEICSGN
jgi:hypothetical protein